MAPPSHGNVWGLLFFIGVYKRFIYLNQAKQHVIVRFSASGDYGQTDDDTSGCESERLDNRNILSV